MTGYFATTPFGGGRMSASIFQRREQVNRQRAALKEGSNSRQTEKWQLIRALSEARAAFGLSDRTIAVLDALLSFHQERELDGSQPIIVFPSNAELSLRSRGMADATLRRHLAALVEAGLILRRDSPNGKRYCRRDERGEVESAFGFDLSPLALAAATIHAAAEEARTKARLCQRLRGEITIHLRDIGKVIEAAVGEQRSGDWAGFSEELTPLAHRLPRGATSDVLQQRRDELLRLRAEVEEAYLACLSGQEVDANDADFERHYQSPKTESQIVISIENGMKPDDDQASVAETNNKIGSVEIRSAPDKLRLPPAVKAVPIPLSYLNRVCPTLADYARDGLTGWPDVLRAAELVRTMLGISPDAWRKARVVMGDVTAAITVAAILERAATIRSPGGYLRSLTQRAETGKFSLLPMLAALENGAGK